MKIGTPIKRKLHELTDIEHADDCIFDYLNDDIIERVEDILFFCLDKIDLQREVCSKLNNENWKILL